MLLVSMENANVRTEKRNEMRFLFDDVSDYDDETRTFDSWLLLLDLEIRLCGMECRSGAIVSTITIYRGSIDDGHTDIRKLSCSNVCQG